MFAEPLLIISVWQTISAFLNRFFDNQGHNINIKIFIYQRTLLTCYHERVLSHNSVQTWGPCTIWQYVIWSQDIKTFGFPGIEFENLGTSSEVKSHQGDQSQNFVGKINYRKVWAKLNFEDESTTFKFREFIQQTRGFIRSFHSTQLEW